jgi:DNA polymerase-3 subunit gamma/tau
VLGTTEAHKIPATIASRCQHFSFRSVDFDDLIARMAWICEQEGIEADSEALAVLAQAGEGSVRDSLSALDQAIACCGSKLDATEVRALLGAFSLESLERVSQALADSDSRRMLEIVDELERNGKNLQHFARELARYLRNLLVARISAADNALGARLIAASPAQRQRMGEIAAQFSEEDLTRYLQLTLDIFRDLQFSLQPRFHLEIGLVRLVQAGRLLPIEQALAGLSSESAPSPQPISRVGAKPPLEPKSPPAVKRTPDAAGTPAAAPAPARTGPSPFDLDRARKAAPRPTEPQSSGAIGVATQPEPEPIAVGDWRQQLHSALMELGLPFTADAIENARVAETGGELQIFTAKSYSLALRLEDLNKAVKLISSRPMRIKVLIGEAGSETVTPLAAPTAKAPSAAEDEATTRALANPEVQRFREVFGGEIRKVRNLKE